MIQRTCDVDGCGNKHRARGLCSTHYNRLVIGENRRHAKTLVPCVICGTLVVRQISSTYAPTCSAQCRSVVQGGASAAHSSGYQWEVDAVRRARKHGALIIETFKREEIFDRDDWTCRACERRCSAPDPYDVTAATVDHVIPLALGGEHSRVNAQTLCLSCNARKRDTVEALAS